MEQKFYGEKDGHVLILTRQVEAPQATDSASAASDVLA